MFLKWKKIICASGESSYAAWNRVDVPQIAIEQKSVDVYQGTDGNLDRKRNMMEPATKEENANDYHGIDNPKEITQNENAHCIYMYHRYYSRWV